MNNQNDILTLQPMIHVTNMEKEVKFYENLGGKIINGSRDGDWTLLMIGNSQISLLAHPTNSEQNEGKVELNFTTTTPLEELKKIYEEKNIKIISLSNEPFGSQLQIETPDRLLIKINFFNPSF